ncbi:hypothetical protein DY000_02022476 [Brassica cretica]|uniref:Uncharacterized protein n=1 Tax=Brassica cretica TaxID=69181 RepID=A0ABQ7E1Z2_BRACR|nr:hypothetical protein DY000_02022476 [Brassica cretica]
MLPGGVAILENAREIWSPPQDNSRGETHRGYLQTLGVNYTVEIELLEDGETPETVRPGYCGAYMSHFEDDGLSFPLPRFLLEALAELEMAFTQMAPNVFRYFLASWVRAQKEGLEFGLRELKQLFAIKRNNGFPGTMILAPRSGRVIIEPFPIKMIDGEKSSLF